MAGQSDDPDDPFMYGTPPTLQQHIYTSFKPFRTVLACFVHDQVHFQPSKQLPAPIPSPSVLILPPPLANAWRNHPPLHDAGMEQLHHGETYMRAIS